MHTFNHEFVCFTSQLKGLLRWLHAMSKAVPYLSSIGGVFTSFRHFDQLTQLK